MRWGRGADVWDGDWAVRPPWFPSLVPAGEPDLSLLEQLPGALAVVGERRADVLDRRLGLSAGSAETLHEIGLDYGVTRERIRQIQAKAIARLKGARTRALRSSVPSPMLTVSSRLDHVFRSSRAAERGRYLRATFPAANGTVLAPMLAACCSARPEDIQRWLRLHDDELRARIEAERESERKANAAHRAAERRNARWAAFERSIIWPEAPHGPSPWPAFAACRDVRTEGGVTWSNKTGRLVQYESGLERTWIDTMEDFDEVVEYCEQPVRIEYPWFDRRRRYVPDFGVHLADGRVVIVEIKPGALWADGMNLAKWNAATRWCATRGWGFAVYDGRRAPQQLLGLDAPGDFDVLERLTEGGPVGMDKLGREWFGTGRSWTRLVATALTHGFAMSRMPFRVQRARNSPWLVEIRRLAA